MADDDGEAAKPFNMDTIDAAIARLSDEQIRVHEIDGMMAALGLNAAKLADVLMAAGRCRHAAELFRLAAVCGVEHGAELAREATAAADAVDEARAGRSDIVYLPIQLYPNERVVADCGTFRLCQDGLWAEVDPDDHTSGPPEHGRLTVEELEAVSFSPLQWPSDADSNPLRRG